MARYLVTGGAGFIGSHVVDVLAARGHKVRVVDDLSTGCRGNLARHTDIELMVADLADPQVAMAAVAGVDYVVHMAAIASVPRSVEEPWRVHRANVDATLQLLLAARGARVRRVVLASTSAVYGESATLPQHEGLRPAPLSPYALHKLVGEEYAKLFNRLHGLGTVALRFFNVFGPRQSWDSPYAGVISRFTGALAAGQAATIHGDGEQTRDFTYVTDAVRATIAACAAPAAAGRIINIARGDQLSVNALYAMLQRITETFAQARHTGRRTGDVRHSQADLSLARDLLGFVPAVPVEEGLRCTLDWLRQHAARVPSARSGGLHAAPEPHAPDRRTIRSDRRDFQSPDEATARVQQLRRADGAHRP